MAPEILRVPKTERSVFGEPFHQASPSIGTAEKDSNRGRSARREAIARLNTEELERGPPALNALPCHIDICLIRIDNYDPEVQTSLVLPRLKTPEEPHHEVLIPYKDAAIVDYLISQ